VKVIVLSENGYDEALLGMSLSFYDHAVPLEDWWTDEKKERAVQRALALSDRFGGHNKFLESINVQLYIQACRSFWSEFDTYRVGMSKNSASTMHTLSKRLVTEQDFEIGTTQASIDALNYCIADYNDSTSIFYKDIARLKNNLPEGWLQERQVSTNYMTIFNITRQRNAHRLKYWKILLENLQEQLEHPELIRWNE